MTDTRSALLNSAQQAARRRGFDGFSYADLAADVGITKASIHHHFPSKATLSVALMAQYRADMEQVCADIDQSHPTGAARLAVMIDRYERALEGGDALCLCVAFSISTQSLSQGVLAEMERFRAMLLEWFSAMFHLGKTDGTIAQVSDPHAEAAATLSLLEGAQLSARAARDPQRFAQATKLLWHRLHT